jgi:hypothetical protein
VGLTPSRPQQTHGDKPTASIGMMHGPGGAVAAARRLLTSSDVQSGFERLIRAGRADLTVEQAVLDDRWAELFTTRIARPRSGV